MEALRSNVITEEEKTALRHEVTEMGRTRFTEKVMQALAGVDNEMVGLYEHEIDNPAFGSAVSHVTDAQKYQTEMMRQHLDAHREVLKTVEVRKKATLR